MDSKLGIIGTASAWLTSILFSSCVFDTVRSSSPVPDETFHLSQIQVRWGGVDSSGIADSARTRSLLIGYHQIAVDQQFRKNATLYRFSDSMVLETVRREFVGIDTVRGREDTLYNSYPISMAGRIYQGEGKKILAMGNSHDCLRTSKNLTSICFEFGSNKIFSNSCILLQRKSDIEEALYGSATYFHSYVCNDVPGIENHSWFEIQYVYEKADNGKAI
jgi:hypothetical protein